MRWDISFIVTLLAFALPAALFAAPPSIDLPSLPPLPGMEKSNNIASDDGLPPLPAFPGAEISLDDDSVGEPFELPPLQKLPEPKIVQIDVPEEKNIAELSGDVAPSPMVLPDPPSEIVSTGRELPPLPTPEEMNAALGDVDADSTPEIPSALEFPKIPELPKADIKDIEVAEDRPLPPVPALPMALPEDQDSLNTERGAMQMAPLEIAIPALPSDLPLELPILTDDSISANAEEKVVVVQEPGSLLVFSGLDGSGKDEEELRMLEQLGSSGSEKQVEFKDLSQNEQVKKLGSLVREFEEEAGLREKKKPEKKKEVKKIFDLEKAKKDLARSEKVLSDESSSKEDIKSAKDTIMAVRSGDKNEGNISEATAESALPTLKKDVAVDIVATDEAVSSNEGGTKVATKVKTVKTSKKPETVKISKTVEKPFDYGKNMSGKNFRTQILSPVVSKKKYRRDNRRLPLSVTEEDLFQRMFHASHRGNVQALRALIKRGVDINVQNQDGNTALVNAALGGQLKSAVILLANGADANIQNNLGFTALHVAANAGRWKIVSVLLQSKANPNLPAKDGILPLALAIAGNHDDVAELLLENGARRETRFMGAMRETMPWDISKEAGAAGVLSGNKTTKIDVMQTAKAQTEGRIRQVREKFSLLSEINRYFPDMTFEERLQVSSKLNVYKQKYSDVIQGMSEDEREKIDSASFIWNGWERAHAREISEYKKLYSAATN